MTRCGKSTDESWRFQVDWRISRRNRLTIECLYENVVPGTNGQEREMSVPHTAATSDMRAREEKG